MKKIKANKIDIANKQLGKIASDVNLPTEINEVDKSYFNVAIIKSVPNPKTLEFEHKVKVQCFSPKAFALHSKRFGQLGHSNVVVFHDPTIKDNQVGDPGEGAKPISYNEMKEFAAELGIQFNSNVSKVDLITKLSERFKESELEFNPENTLEEVKSIYIVK